MNSPASHTQNPDAAEFRGNRVTFLQSPADFELLAPFGFNHWLLEHPAFSLQAAHDNPDSDFRQLAATIRLIPSEHEITFNLDIMALPGDFSILAELLTFLREVEVDRIRVQDFGLFNYLLHQTGFELELSPHTGGAHAAWWGVFAAAAGSRLKVMHLPDLVPADAATRLMGTFPGLVELLACGPLLMYHSHRQLFSADELSQEGWISGEEKQRPGMRFRWRCGDHGTLMYHYQWRNLLLQLLRQPELQQGRLLFDWRCAAPELITDLMPLFENLPRQEDLQGLIVELGREHGLQFSGLPEEAVSDAGTDKVSSPEKQPLALVLHRAGREYLLLQAQREFATDEEFMLQLPGGDSQQVRLTDPRDLNADPVATASPGQLLLCDSLPSIVPGSRLYTGDRAVTQKQ